LDVSGKRVLVTGASRGIGAALADRFAKAGAEVALVARSEGPLKDLANSLGGCAYPTDLADLEAATSLIDTVEADGPVDILVNNAGLVRGGWFLREDPMDTQQLVRLNVTAPMILCRQVLPRMLQRGRGHIVNVSSMAACGVFPGMTTYSATKAALSHFTAGLRAELRGFPLKTTLVELGPLDTDMLGLAEEYRPSADSFRRLYLTRLLTKVSMDQVADAVIDAVMRSKRHVRLPRRAAAFSMLVEAPRRLTEIVLSGVRHQA
jgi:uncharacterized protein